MPLCAKAASMVSTLCVVKFELMGAVSASCTNRDGFGEMYFSTTIAFNIFFLYYSPSVGLFPQDQLYLMIRRHKPYLFSIQFRVMR